VEENLPKEVKEDILPVDHRSELARKLQRLNQRCLHQRKPNLKEPKQVVKESLTHIKEKKHEERT
jgi:hypothetical protein